MFVLFLFFCSFFVNDFSTTRRPIHAKFCMRAYSGSGCVFSPLGLAAPGGGKRGKWNFRYYKSQCGIFAFWAISQQRGGRVEGELKTQKMGVVSFVQRPATISIFLSASKCGSVCMAQTCAHSGVEPSRSAKAFLQGGPKSSKKLRFFHHFDNLRPYISQTVKNRGT